MTIQEHRQGTRPYISFSRALGRAIRAETLKSRTTAFMPSAVFFTALVTLVAAIGLGMIGRNATANWGNGDSVAEAHFALIGLLVVGVLALLANAVWAVVGEQIGHTAGVTALAIPSRGTVVAAKAVVAGVITVITTAVLVPTALVAAQLSYAPDPGTPGFLGGDVLRIAVVLPLVFGCLSIAAVGVAAAIGNAAVSLAVVVGWYVLAEDWIQRIPQVGEAIASYLPVSAGLSLAGVEGTPTAALTAVGQAVALVAATAVLVWLGIFFSSRRDVKI